MEKVKIMVQALRARSLPATEQEIINVIREYLQVLVLKLIFQSKYGSSLSFMGGTCLRICYDLKRYSEDLDFSLDAPDDHYRFSSLITLLKKDLQFLGFVVTTNVHEDKTVQKAFLRFSDLGEVLNLKSFRKRQKLHVKLEVDVRPPRLEKGERESFFINRFQEIFPILKHTLPTLFSGKILAIFNRPYRRGRDYYDLIWYLSRKTPINLSYLNRQRRGLPFDTESSVFAALRSEIQQMPHALILKDIGSFLEDPREADWIRRYPELFEQLISTK